MAEARGGSPWWAEKKLASGNGIRWTLGPLALAVSRLEREWQIAHGPSNSPEEHDEIVVTPIDTPPESAETLERYAVDPEQDSLRCRPALADRSVVVRPRLPVFIASREELRIFVSSPIWITVEIGPPWQVFSDLPVKRLSDTWFGPSTLEGELAYALRTQARVLLAEMPQRHHRAVTPVTIRNEGSDILPVERMNLPVPYLSVFASSGGLLWTEEVTMRRSSEDSMATFEVGSSPPPEAPEAVLVTGPRREREGHHLVRAFTSIIQTLRMGGEQ